jgi:pseudouridylate synthase
MRTDAPKEAALIVSHHFSISQSGLVIAQPIDENEALSSQWVEEIIAMAINKADHAHIRGKEVTPFLLAEIAKATNQESVRCNCSLLIKNARLASRIAKALGEIPSDKVLRP